MKIKAVALASLLSISASAVADTGVSFGFVYDFGAKPQLGFSAKLISKDVEEQFVGALGVSYFPTATYKLGADIGVGFTLKNSVITAGYDVFKKKPQVGLGYMKTQ